MVTKKIESRNAIWMFVIQFFESWILTPVAELFLTRLGFEKIFKTQGIFKIKERFQVMFE